MRVVPDHNGEVTWGRETWAHRYISEVADSGTANGHDFESVSSYNYAIPERVYA